MRAPNLHLLVLSLITALALSCITCSAAESGSSSESFSRVATIIAEHCLDCHAAQDPEGKLVLESYDLILKGGETGSVIIPGKPDESLLVKMIEGKYEKDGKTKIMPPGKKKKLTAEEITTIREWISAGASAPADKDKSIAKEIIVPKIEPKVPARHPINSAAYDTNAKLLALGRYAEVEIHSAENQTLLRKLEGIHGNVNSVAFSADGKFIFAGGGDSGITGEVLQWQSADGKLVRNYPGHKDSVYAVAVSPDGKTLATGSYDQKVKLWNTETGAEIKTLSGHNGCIYGLGFRADGKILASASGDRTVKLWDVATGERRDTLSQSLKELYTVQFSPDGKRLAAGGVDNRIRVWDISPEAKETTNPLLYSKFAHEGAILRLTFSIDGKLLASTADDKTLKIWDAADLSEKLILETQPDWAPGIAFALENKALFAGRLDGSSKYYNSASGSVLAPPKPELARVEPRSIQRGVTTKIQLAGKFLQSVDSLKFSNDKIKAELIHEGEPKPTELWVNVTADSSLPRGAYDLSVKSSSGESGAIKLYIDDIPQFSEKEKSRTLPQIPIAIWGVHETSGDFEQYRFRAKKSHSLVFDAAAKAIGSKADLVLTLADGKGKVLASSSNFDQSPDPLIHYTFKDDGEYVITVSELLLGASPEHFYRLSIGEFPFVTAVFPSIIPAEKETELHLIGFNLPSESTIKIAAAKPGDQPLNLDPEKFRWRGALKVLASQKPQFLESEPNNDLEDATSVSLPAIISGRIFSTNAPQDEDWFRFDAKAGETWILETAAAQIGSPLDTKIEVLDSMGKPVIRTLLQAVRDSAITFRGIDSNSADCRVENWEEMELNQLLYLQGEVVKLFRAPQGPDSGFLFYTLNGKRRDYFDTSPTAHANAEPCYIVETHTPGSKLVQNGLPVFPIYFQNDDDSERRLGTDSRLFFTAAADASYFVRLTDTRGFSGDRFIYRLSILKAEPDFRVTLNGANLAIAPGSGQSFSVSAERIDGFDGEIKVEISGLPPGFSVSNPLVIQAGHTTALGTMNADPNAAKPGATNSSKVIASASINGKVVSKEVNTFGQIKLADSASLYVALESENSATPEITIAPGQTVPARLKVRRNGHDDLITFSVDNLPHGVIVDNIGLSGVLIPKDQNEREIFITAAKWVPETDRLCYAVSNEAGRQTSRPVLLKVRKNNPKIVAEKGG
jgi:WD40 repeat protein